MPAPIIADIRVSTDKQGKSGLGLSAQRDAISKFAANEFLEVAGEFIEVVEPRRSLHFGPDDQARPVHRRVDPFMLERCETRPIARLRRR
jgi:hypothetical protein